MFEDHMERAACTEPYLWEGQTSAEEYGNITNFFATLACSIYRADSQINDPNRGEA